jgi:hypothetical protein
VALFKSGLRKFLAACPEGRWWEFLGDVARGVRVAPTAATRNSPFYLVFKQQPVLPFLT